MKSIKLTALTALFLVLAACNDSKKAELNDESNLRLGMVNFLDVANPYTKSGDYFWYMQREWVFNTLVKMNDKTGFYEPLLAESFEWMNGNKSLKYTLRKDVKWSDGMPVTTKDIVFSIFSHDEPKRKSVYMNYYSQVLESHEVLNDREIVFHLKEARLENLWVLGASLFIMPEHIYRDGSPKMLTVGVGPYVMKRFVPSKRVELVKNPNWYGKNVVGLKDLYKFDRITVVMVASINDYIDYMEKDKIDYFRTVDPKAFSQFEATAKKGRHWVPVKSDVFTVMNHRGLLVNHRVPALGETAVRRAIMMAFDRRTVVKKIYDNGYGISSAPVTPTHRYYPKGKVEPIEYDPKKAIEVLTQAGWLDKNKDGIREKIINGKTETLEFDLVNWRKDRRAMFTMFQGYMKKAGIKINIVERNYAAGLKLAEEHKFDFLYVASNLGDEPDIKGWLHSAGGIDKWSNIGGVNDPVIDALSEKLDKAFDFNVRKKLLEKIFVRFQEQATHLTFFDDRYRYYVINKRIKRPQDYFPNSVGFHTWSL